MTARSAAVRRICDVGIIAVVRADSAQDAVRLAEAVLAGGLPVVEITLTVPGALQVVERLAQDFGDAALIGAGSVRDADGARACIASGARFVVSPVLETGVIEACRAQDVAVIPGALTPTEILAACAAGADLVKVFPASALGGPGYIRALRNPLPGLGLVPTGGVTLASIPAYIGAGASALGAGSDLVDPQAAREGRLDGVTQAARAWADAVRAARVTASRPA